MQKIFSTFCFIINFSIGTFINICSIVYSNIYFIFISIT